MMYTGSSGLWDTVWLECVPAAAYVSDLYVTPDINDGSVTVLATLTTPAAAAVQGTQGAPQALQLTATVTDGATVVGTASGAAGAPFTVRMPPGFKRWSPSSPFLYNVSVSVSSGGDAVQSYFGMRKVSVGPVTTAGGRKMPAVLLNDKPFYQVSCPLFRNGARRVVRVVWWLWA
jgi:beta-galactosidase/beta-glucuronidase